MKKYDYAKAAQDRVLGWFWFDKEKCKRIGFLTKYIVINGISYFFRSSYNKSTPDLDCESEHFEFYNESDAEKYEIKEPEIVPFATAEELMKSEFWGKIMKAVSAYHTSYLMLIGVDVANAYSPKWWFDNYQTLDGRKIGKLKES